MQPLDPQTPKSSRYRTGDEDEGAANPYQAPSAGRGPSGLKPLGSLAQSARLKELKTARVILFVVGVLNLVLALIILGTAEMIVQAQVAQAGPGQEIDQAKVEQNLMAIRVTGGVALVLGVTFFTFGLIIKRYPVPVTVTSLAIYLIMTVVDLLNNPAMFQNIVALVVRVAIIVALVKATRAAFAFRAEQRAMEVEDEYA